MSQPWLTPARSRELAAEAERAIPQITRNANGDEHHRRAGPHVTAVMTSSARKAHPPVSRQA